MIKDRSEVRMKLEVSQNEIRNGDKVKSEDQK